MQDESNNKKHTIIGSKTKDIQELSRKGDLVGLDVELKLMELIEHLYPAGSNYYYGGLDVLDEIRICGIYNELNGVNPKKIQDFDDLFSTLNTLDTLKLNAYNKAHENIASRISELEQYIKTDSLKNVALNSLKELYFLIEDENLDLYYYKKDELKTKIGIAKNSGYDLSNVLDRLSVIEYNLNKGDDHEEFVKTALSALDNANIFLEQGCYEEGFEFFEKANNYLIENDLIEERELLQLGKHNILSLYASKHMSNAFDFAERGDEPSMSFELERAKVILNYTSSFNNRDFFAIENMCYKERMVSCLGEINFEIFKSEPNLTYLKNLGATFGRYERKLKSQVLFDEDLKFLSSSNVSFFKSAVLANKQIPNFSLKKRREY